MLIIGAYTALAVYPNCSSNVSDDVVSPAPCIAVSKRYPIFLSQFLYWIDILLGPILSSVIVSTEGALSIKGKSFEEVDSANDTGIFCFPIDIVEFLESLYPINTSSTEALSVLSLPCLAEAPQSTDVL